MIMGCKAPKTRSKRTLWKIICDMEIMSSWFSISIRRHKKLTRRNVAKNNLLPDKKNQASGLLVWILIFWYYIRSKKLTCNFQPIWMLTFRRSKLNHIQVAMLLSNIHEYICFIFLADFERCQFLLFRLSMRK